LLWVSTIMVDKIGYNSTASVTFANNSQPYQ